jgi:hypothetical protein
MVATLLLCSASRGGAGRRRGCPGRGGARLEEDRARDARTEEERPGRGGSQGGRGQAGNAGVARSGGSGWVTGQAGRSGSGGWVGHWQGSAVGNEIWCERAFF